MLAHSPISFPNIMDYGVAIPPSSEVFIHIEPEVITAEPNLKSVQLVRFSRTKCIINLIYGYVCSIDGCTFYFQDKRGCYLPEDDEAKLNTYKFYTADNCKDECIAQKTYDTCKCVRHFMPRKLIINYISCNDDLSQDIILHTFK